MADDIFSSTASQLPDQFGALFQKQREFGEQEAAKSQAAEEELASKKGQYNIDVAKAKAAAARAGVGGEQAVYKKYEKELMAPAPTIQYDQDTKQGMTSLAALLPMAAAMIGGKGQMSALGAIQSMSGILKGHEEGNQARIALEEKNFKQRLEDFKSHQEQVKAAFERALQMAKLNSSAAQAQLEVKLAELGAPILAAQVKRDGVVSAATRNLAAFDKMTGVIESSLSNMYKTENKGMYEAAVGVGAKGQLAKMIGPEAAAATPEKDAAATVAKIQGIKSTVDLIDLAKDPEIKFGELGRLTTNASSLLERNVSNAGGVNSSSESQAIIDKSVDEAAQKAGLSPTDKNVLFIKKATFTALELERAAHGGSLLPYGVMRTLGPLLDPKRMTRETYIGILQDRANEIARGTGLNQDQITRAISSVPNISIGGSAPVSTPAAAPKTTQQAPDPTKKYQLRGRPIEVQNGKWVFSDTGEEAK